MEDLEKTQRLQEILAKLDPWAETKVRDGGLFKTGELLRRRLIHEGTLLWKTPGSRLKGRNICFNFSEQYVALRDIKKAQSFFTHCMK